MPPPPAVPTIIAYWRERVSRYVSAAMWDDAAMASDRLLNLVFPGRWK